MSDQSEGPRVLSRETGDNTREGGDEEGGMKERPIQFSGPMVRAILRGEKTQTRRTIKPQPEYFEASPYWRWKGFAVEAGDTPSVFGRYAIGERLWVKETWWKVPEPSLREILDGADTWPKPIGPQEQRVAYAADGDDPDTVREWGWQLKPSIYLPRWASRITLEITDVRVQRLQEISNEDAYAEGCQGGKNVEGYSARNPADPYEEFAILWDSINAKKNPWNSNPWVWSISFRRIEEAR